MIALGVNIDHIATLRQARKETFPDPVEAAKAAIKGGAGGITAHLREDRRHIQDADIRLLKKLPVPLNMEMAANDDILRVALNVKPAWACLVPEKRSELTTEGGLDVEGNRSRLARAVRSLHGDGIKVSFFIEPDVRVVRLAGELGADAVELHTGRYARLWDEKAALPLKKEVSRIQASARLGQDWGLLVNAGHGINYDNVATLARVFPFDEFNIGFAIVAHAVFVGMERAVREMKKRMRL